MSEDEDNERAPTPLLSKFEKWPEYIEISFKPDGWKTQALIFPTVAPRIIWVKTSSDR